MVTASELKAKYVKEIGKRVQSEKALQTRLIKAAKAGLTQFDVTMSAKKVVDLVTVLQSVGYITKVKDNNVVVVSWS